MRAPAKSKTPSRTVRAHVRKERMVPVETLGLPEGAEVIVTIRRAKASALVDPILSTAGAWKDSVDAEKLIRQIYRDRLGL